MCFCVTGLAELATKKYKSAARNLLQTSFDHCDCPEVNDRVLLAWTEMTGICNIHSRVLQYIQCLHHFRSVLNMTIIKSNMVTWDCEEKDILIPGSTVCSSNWCAYDINHIYMNCRYRIEAKVILSFVKQLKQLQRKPRNKKRSFNRIWTHDLHNTSAMLYQLSYEASMEAIEARGRGSLGC